MAEVVHHFFPHFVDVHNYPPSNSADKKAYNWQTLNRALPRSLPYLRCSSG